MDNLLLRCLLAALATGIAGFVVLDADFVVAESLRKLSGAQIRAKFAGMQLTDEVHYRFVYERDGTLRSVAMGVKKRGKWVVDKGQLCLYLQEPDDRCYDVALSGKTFYTDACRTGIRPGRHSPAYLRSGVSTKMSSQIVEKVSQEKAEDCVLLTYAGGQPPEGGWLIMSRIRLVARIERPRPLSNSISQPVLPATLSATP